MNATQFNIEILQPSILKIESVIKVVPNSISSNLLLLTIAGQESRWTHRYQLGGRKGSKGPARGFWQFERNGGVAGVMEHRETSSIAKALVNSLGLPWDRRIIWESLETNDSLAVGFARLLLWIDSRPLPSPLTGVNSAWNYYIRNWRPGKPKKNTWIPLWKESQKTLGIT